LGMVSHLIIIKWHVYNFAKDIVQF
jgi:hypothetical protein